MQAKLTGVLVRNQRCFDQSGSNLWSHLFVPIILEHSNKVSSMALRKNYFKLRSNLLTGFSSFHTTCNYSSSHALFSAIMDYTTNGLYCSMLDSRTLVF